MKIKIIPCIAAIILSGLVAFGFYTWCRCDSMNLLIAIAGGAVLLLTSCATLGISLSDSKMSINVKVLSGIFTCLFLVINIIFCCLTSFSIPLYAIINGVLLVVWLLISYGIAKQ